MKLAFILFDQMTSLDLIGFYDPVTRLQSMGFMPELQWQFCAQSEEIRDDRGLVYRVERGNNDLSGYDMLFIPGGMGTRSLLHDAFFIDWIKTAEPVPNKVSVCTGSLLLGAAGFLQDKQATTHRNGYDLLKPFCREVREERIVSDGQVITGGGVATSVDLGLYVCERLAGPEVARKIQQQMDYPYYQLQGN